MKSMLSLLLLLLADRVSADADVEFLAALCVPELDFFELRIARISNPHPLLDEQGRLRPSEASKSLAPQGQLPVGLPGTLRCQLTGMEVEVSNVPYAVTPTDLRPGSRIILRIGDHTYIDGLDFATYRSGKPYATNLSVDGTGPGAAVVVLTGRRAGERSDFLLTRRVPASAGAEMITAKTLDRLKD